MLTLALGVLLCASASAEKKASAVRIEDLQPIADGSVEPAPAVKPRRPTGSETAEEEPRQEAPPAPKKGFGRPLKPVRKALLKPSTLPAPQAASYNKDNAAK